MLDRSKYGTRYRAGMVPIRIDEQLLANAVRDELQRSGTGFARLRVSTAGIGVRACRGTGAFGTKEQK